MNKRVEDIEFRWSETNNAYELVRWLNRSSGKDYCIVIAFFDLGDEGCDIRFVGDRPFATDNKELVWNMLKYGQAIVDAVFELGEVIPNA